MNTKVLGLRPVAYLQILFQLKSGLAARASLPRVTRRPYTCVCNVIVSFFIRGARNRLFREGLKYGASQLY